jgi:hypothetical protein
MGKVNCEKCSTSFDFKEGEAFLNQIKKINLNDKFFSFLQKNGADTSSLELSVTRAFLCPKCLTKSLEETQGIFLKETENRAEWMAHIPTLKELKVGDKVSIVKGNCPICGKPRTEENAGAGEIVEIKEGTFKSIVDCDGVMVKSICNHKSVNQLLSLGDIRINHR